MRSGRLLAQESPDNLLRNYGIDSLEEVFLKLCMKDGKSKRPETVTNAVSSNGTASRTNKRVEGGHDNKAFNYSLSQFDVSQVGMEPQQLRAESLFHPGSLARYTVVNNPTVNNRILNFKIIVGFVVILFTIFSLLQNRHYQQPQPMVLLA